tara:strand:+ start:35602 stop:35925 length:324 start_codon:yes stop_codon:yes gene_type:complete
MSNPYNTLDYMEARDEQKRVSDAQREFSVMMMEFKNRWAKVLEVETSTILDRAADDAEQEFLSTMIDDAEGGLKARLSDIDEEGSREDYRAEVRHMTAQPVNLKAAI